jgi:hypothetical protein
LKRYFGTIYFSLGIFFAVVSLTGLVSAATTQIHIARYASDNVTVLNETTVTYQWMETHLPVMGDGRTHYYLQGPVFVDDADPAREEQLRWNADEDSNMKEKDMGAVKGTDLKDLCDLVGGMSPGDIVKVKAEDGFAKTFAYENVYKPSARQGSMVVAWYNDAEGYVPQYRTGMRLIFFADNSTNPWGLHAFGNNDWKVSASPEYWYFYRQGDEKYPTTTGLSVQYISDILIYSHSPDKVITTQPTTAIPTPARAGFSPYSALCVLTACVFLRYSSYKRG